MSERLVVGIGECAVSAQPDSVIVTYALGSCVAVSMYDPVAKVGGLLHYMLPLSVLGAKQAQDRPCTYCDSGLRVLLDRMRAAGAERTRLQVRAAGGAQVLDQSGYFNIGQKNERILHQILAGMHLPLLAGEFGGSVSRTVGLELSSGNFWIKQWPIETKPVRPVAAEARFS